MRFYVLVSYAPARFEQSLIGLPKDKTQIVINTLDKEVEQELIQVCDLYEVPYVVTESDGTPATGKNSMIDVFLESDDDYAMFIDSGDIITPTGVEYYQLLAEHDNPPDLLVLYKQVAVMKVLGTLLFDMLEKDFPEEWRAHYPYDKNIDGVCHMTEEELYEYLKFQGKIEGEEELRRQAKERYMFHQYMNNYSDKNEYMTRMVFMSRRCAHFVDYDNSLLIGEDTVQYLKLKKLGEEKFLRVFKKPDGLSTPPTYLQVICTESITAPKTLTWDWCVPINRKLKQMEWDGELPTAMMEVPTFHLT